MTGFLKGSATAMITPFQGEGVDLEVFGALAEHQLSNGTDALVVLGTTGEPATMTEREKETLMRYACERFKGRTKLIFGAGGNCTRTAVEACISAEALGADGVLCVTPYYNKCTQQGLYEHYRAICEAVSVPVIAYNVPLRTGVNIAPETMARIAELKNMAGIKEASGNMAQVLETARLIRGKCELYSGDDALNLPILCAGGTAVISVVSNLAPAGVKAMTEAVFSGDLGRANELNDALLPLVKACFLEVNPIPVKAGVNALGFCAGSPRAPLTELAENCRTQLIAAMKNYGLKVKE